MMPYPTNYQPGYRAGARRRPDEQLQPQPTGPAPAAPGVAPPPPIPPRARPPQVGPMQPGPAQPLAVPQPAPPGYPRSPRPTNLAPAPRGSEGYPRSPRPTNLSAQTGGAGFENEPGASTGPGPVSFLPDGSIVQHNPDGSSTVLRKAAGETGGVGGYGPFTAGLGGEGGGELDPMSDLEDDGLELGASTGSGGYRDDLDALIRDSLQNPSRYDIKLVEEGLGVIDRDLAEQRENAIRGLDEHFASRGLIGYGGPGSSIENHARADLLSDLENQRQERVFNLGREFATTQAQDRATAAGLGFTQQDIDLRAQQLQQQYALEGRRLDIQEAQFLASQQLQREQMAQQGSQFQQQLDFDRDRFKQQFEQSERQWLYQKSAAERQQILDIVAELAAAGWKKAQIDQYLESLGLKPKTPAAQPTTTAQPDLTDDVITDDEVYGDF